MAQRTRRLTTDQEIVSSNLTVDMKKKGVGGQKLCLFDREAAQEKPPERVKMPSGTAKTSTAWLCRVTLESSPVDAAGIGSL